MTSFIDLFLRFVLLSALLSASVTAIVYVLEMIQIYSNKRISAGVPLSPLLHDFNLQLLPVSKNPCRRPDVPVLCYSCK
jgi:hypothetical protein